MSTFRVNENDSARMMLDKLNAYVLEIKKEKYNNVLKLLNELFEQKHKSIRNFTKIDCEYFESKSVSKIIKLLDKYSEKLEIDVNKIKEYYEKKKETKKLLKDQKSIKDVTDMTNVTNINGDRSNETEKVLKIKSKTKSGSTKEEFTVSKEIFTIIAKLIKSLDYKLVKSLNCGKQSYSCVMNI